MVNILLITGDTGIGKDTLAQNIKDLDEISYYPHIYSFGDALKKFTSEIFELPLEDFYNKKNQINNRGFRLFCKDKDGYSTNRGLLQGLSDVVKKYDQTFFTRMTLDNVEEVPFIIFPDWRFYYELDLLRRRFPMAKIRTIRLKQKDKASGTHNSDTSLKGITVDFELDNSRLSPQQTCEITLKRLQIFFPELFN